MEEKTLEQIEEIAKKEFPEWGHDICEEPTIMKNFKGKDGKLIGVLIDEEGAAITGYVNENDVVIPISLEEWRERFTAWFGMYKYNEKDGTITPVEELMNHFNQETVDEILVFTKRWLEIIE